MPLGPEFPTPGKRKRKGGPPPPPPPFPQAAPVPPSYPELAQTQIREAPSVLPAPMPLAMATGGEGSDYYTQLALAETASVGTLPTATVDAMVQAGMKDDDLWKAASIFAQITDLSPRWFLPNKDEYTIGDLADPMTGVPLSFSEARTAFKVYEPFYIYTLLKGRLEDLAPPAPPRRAGRGEPPRLVETPLGGVDATRLANAFAALSAVDGDALKFQDALAWGIGAAQDESFDLEAFAQNLAMVNRAQGVFTEGYTPMRAMAIATEATRRGLKFNDPKEVLLAMDPGVAGLDAEMQVVEDRLVEYFGQEFVDRAKADPASDEGQYYLGQRNAELSRMGWDLTDLSVFEGMLEAVGNTETDYIEAGNKIAEDLKLAKGGLDIGNTVVGRWAMDWILNPAIHIWNATLGSAERVALDPALWGMTPKGQMFGVTSATRGQTNVEAIQAEALQGALLDAKDFVMNRGSNAFEELTKEGIPMWVTMLADLGLGFKFGPDILALRTYTRLTRDAKLMAGPEAWAKALDHVFKWRQLGGQRGVTIPEAIANAARSETRAEVVLSRLTHDLTGYFGVGLHPTVSSELFMLARADLRAGRAYVDVVGDIREALLYGANATTRGKYSQRLAQMWEAQKEAADRIFVNFDRAGAPAEQMLKEAARARWAMSDMAHFNYTVGGSDALLEIPHLRNPLSRTLGAIGSSRFADTAFGRAIDAITNTTPPRVFSHLQLNLEDVNLMTDAEAALVRSRVFSVAERSEYLTRLGGFQNPLNPYRERLFAGWIDEVNDEIVNRVMVQNHLTTEQMEIVQRNLNTYWGKYRERADTFGAYTKYTEITPHEYMAEQVFAHEPYLPSQLLNTAALWDPVALRHGIAEAVGTMRQARNAILRAVHLGVPEAKFAMAIKGHTLRNVLDNIWEAIVHDLFLTIWKPLVVMRPAYILRVVGIEEQGRFLSTVGGMRRLEASRIAGRLVDKFGHRSISLEVPLMGHTTEEVAQSFIDTTVRNVAGAGTHDLVPTVTDIGGGMARIDIPTPASGMLARQTYAETSATRFALSGREGVLHETFGTYARSWEPIARGEKDFIEFWQWDLVRQFGPDTVGNMHLLSVRNGMEEEDAVRWITDLLMSDEHRATTTARLMGTDRFSRAQVEMQVRRGQSVITGYTVGRQPEIARLALDGTLTTEFLKGIPTNLQPAFIHGPELEMVLSRVSTLKRGQSALGNLILRMPTNAFSRSPYAAHWYSRTREAMLDILKSQGDTLTPEILRSIDTAAERFAKLQVNRIMFDFTRSGRFGEMTAAIFPFFQPYAEAFLVWGRIIRENPTTLGYVRQLITAADNSGLLEKNQWGERVMPMTNWLMGAWFLQRFTGAPGWQLSSPYSSFNLWFQSAMPIPTGPILGDFPFPLPALAPPFTAIAQMALYSDVVKDNLDPSVRSRMLSWAMEFGNITAQSMLPSYARHFVEAAVPGWFENEMNNQADNALRTLAWQGMTAEKLANDPAYAMETTGRTFQITQEDGTKIPDLEAATVWLADKATGMAKSIALWRGFASMFFPAAPRLEWPHSEWLTELRTIREQYPDDWEKVKDTFLSRHPDGWQFLISNSTWDPELVGHSLISIPASEAVQRLFAGKGASDFWEKFPEFAFFIIPKEIRDGQYDPGVLWAQVRAGQRGILTPYEKLVGEAVQRGWDTWFDYNDAWIAWQEAHPDANIGDPDYLIRKAQYDEQVRDLKVQNTFWADDYAGFTNHTGVDAKVLAHAWMLAKDEMFLKTDLGQALAVFLPKMETMQHTLASYAISNITNVAAQEMGLTERWDGLLKYLSDTYGEDWDTAYRLFFSRALEGVESRAAKWMAKLSSSEFLDVTSTWDEIRALDERIANEQVELRQNALYQERRELSSQLIREYGLGMENPMRSLWESRDPSEKTRSREFLSTLPYYWLSEFDRRIVLGETTSPYAEEQWAWYGDERTKIQWRENHDPDYSSGEAYDKLDKELARRAKKSGVLTAQIEKANDWSYLFFKAHPELLQDTNLGQDEWSKMLKFSDQMKQAFWDSGFVTASDLTYNADFKVWYQELYESWDKWLRTDLFDNVDFKRQWRDLQDHYDEPLLRTFFPVTYYPIGGGG